ncbi:MAG: hypothetical protein KC417_11930, partial [Myxococcales bacterium]|nr:hypothetical protein [Myxococcales bacterium]
RRVDEPEESVVADANALAVDALEAERRGDVPAALELAKRAFDTHPGQAQALLLLYEHRDKLDRDWARKAVFGARTCLGDNVSLLAELARIAKADGDTALYDEAIEMRFQLAPQDAALVQKRLELRTAGSDLSALEQSVRDALAVDRFDHAPTMRAALRRIHELGGDALEPGLRAVERLGGNDPSLVVWVTELSERDARPHMRVLALEHAFARARDADKGHILQTLAAHFRDQGNSAAEARTLVRALAVAPYHPGALERLTEIYSAAGDPDRLMAVLSLRLEAAPHPDDRAARLRDLAAAALHLAGDRNRALGFVQAIIDEAGDDPIRIAFGIRALIALHRPTDVVGLLAEQAMRRDPKGAAPLWIHAVAIAETEAQDKSLALATAIKGLGHTPQSAGLLLAFERLALEIGEFESGRAVYRTLMDRALGMHGRRALAYREARWLQRAGDTRAALDAYAQTFALSPSGGVVFASLEHLAQELGEWEPLIAACMTLAERTSDADTRVRHFARAADLCETEVGSPRRAFEAYLRAWRETGNDGMKTDAHRLAKVLAERSPTDGADAYSAYI